MLHDCVLSQHLNSFMVFIFYLFMHKCKASNRHKLKFIWIIWTKYKSEYTVAQLCEDIIDEHGNSFEVEIFLKLSLSLIF